MAWGKSEDEKQQEREAREAEDRAEAAAYVAQQQAIQDAADAAAFASSPVGRATNAFRQGSVFFQTEIAVSSLSGQSSFFGSSDNSLQHTGAAPDVLGQIEAIGWRLEHTGYVFVETGATTSDSFLGSGQGMVTQGDIVGIFLFRRVVA
jgi:hypothetical protein